MDNIEGNITQTEKMRSDEIKCWVFYIVLFLLYLLISYLFKL